MATFYALFSVVERPPRVVHVCDDVACRCAGSEELIAQLGPEGEAVDGATWLRSPCLGQCDRAPAAMLTEAGDEPLERELARVDADGVQGDPRRRDAAAAAVDHAAAVRRDAACGCSGASAMSTRRASTTTARTAATTRCAARSTSAPRA